MPAAAHQGRRFPAQRDPGARRQGRQGPADDAAAHAGRAIAARGRAHQVAAPVRPCGRVWRRLAAARPGAQVPVGAAGSSRGSMSSPPASARSIRATGSSAVTISTTASSPVRSRPPAARPASTSRSVRTPCAIPSPPTCSRPATTSARSRNCSATRTCRPRRSIPTSSIAVAVAC